MGFLIQLGLAAVGLWLVLVLSIFAVAGAIFLWRILRAPVSNKVAYVAAAILIGVIALPLVAVMVVQ